MKDINVQAQNKVTVVGKLLDVVFGEGQLSDGRHYERATLTIRTTQTYGGREETSEIPVSLFATQYTSTGKQNPAWTSMQTIKTLKTAQNVGIDEADTVRVSSGNLQENNFVSRNGQLINGWQIRSSFISGAKVAEVASFICDIFIMDMHDEVDRNDEPTGRLVVKGGLVQYGGKLDVLEFIVEDPNAVDFISRNWEINQTVTVKGRIRVTSIEEKSSGNDTSWGEDIPETTTHFIRELIITKGDDEGKEEEFAYNPADIKNAFNVRKANIEQMQLDAKNGGKKAAAPAKSTSNKYSWEE